MFRSHSDCWLPVQPGVYLGRSRAEWGTKVLGTNHRLALVDGIWVTDRTLGRVDQNEQ